MATRLATLGSYSIATAGMPAAHASRTAWNRMPQTMSQAEMMAARASSAVLPSATRIGTADDFPARLSGKADVVLERGGRRLKWEEDDSERMHAGERVGRWARILPALPSAPGGR